MSSTISSYLAHAGLGACLFLLICLASCWIWPQWGGQLFGQVERFTARLAQRKQSSILLLMGFAVAARLSLLPVLPVPVPHVHDEFSYLLAGDTFAHGRLTNPPHPMWVFFDTFHVNQHPTYMSKYPPAQGLVLALGQVFGHPWIGVLLSAAVMCSVVLWMLYGWLPPRWALLGGFLIFLRFAVFSYWMNSYWGGAIPAIGGALVLGATPRLVRFLRGRDALLLAVGASLLANSRPFEGLLLCLPLTVYLLVRLGSKLTPERTARLFLILSLFCAVIIPSAAFMGYYNWRGTGSPLVFPYAVNEQTYLSTPTFFWQKVRPPMQYANPQFEAFYNGWSRKEWLQGRVNSVGQTIRHIGLYGIKVSYFFLWPELFLPLLALPFVLRDHRIRLLVAVIAVSFLGLLLVPWIQAHYAAPLTGALFGVVVQGIRHLRQCKLAGRPIGIGFSRVIVLFALLLAPLHPHSEALGRRPPQDIEYRAEFQKRLSQLHGNHLVIVRYTLHHPVLQEWVYNAADIDHSRVVWAREIPGRDLKPLLQYFSGRDVWLVEPDAVPPRLTPYLQSTGAE